MGVLTPFERMHIMSYGSDGNLGEVMGELTRGERLQIMLTDEELAALDDWRFSKRMPSRAAAVRELLKRGLAAEGFAAAKGGSKSKDYGVVEALKGGAKKPR
jgi:hypothetical protein